MIENNVSSWLDNAVALMVVVDEKMEPKRYNRGPKRPNPPECIVFIPKILLAVWMTNKYCNGNITMR